MQLLIENGANINAANTPGDTALILAISAGIQMNLTFLYKRILELKTTSPILGYDRIGELLIQKGANVNAVDKDNRSALMFAALKGSISNVFEDLLLSMILIT